MALGPGLEARGGVLTGEAAVTLGAIGQGMVAGDLVNTASRLQSAAAPGTVLVGEATQRAASIAITFEPAGEQYLKGKAAPVAAWRAVRVVAQRRGRGREDRLEAPFVGRDAELRLLKDLFHATTRERRVRLVSITGPGRRRQDPARLGVPEIRRRPGRRRLLARRPLPGLRAGAFLLGPRRDGPLAGRPARNR